MLLYGPLDAGRHTGEQTDETFTDSRQGMLLYESLGTGRHTDEQSDTNFLRREL